MPDHSMQIEPWESRILEDFSQDDHSLWEVFGLIRGERPDASDSEVFKAGRQLLETWIGRGWLQLAGDGDMWGAAGTINDVLPLVDRIGMDATRYFVGSPWLRLTPRAEADLQRLRGTA